MTITKTKYYGIHIQHENGKYWIFDANGGDKYFGFSRPSEKDIENYRNTL